MDVIVVICQNHDMPSCCSCICASHLPTQSHTPPTHHTHTGYRYDVTCYLTVFGLFRLVLLYAFTSSVLVGSHTPQPDHNTTGATVTTYLLRLCSSARLFTVLTVTVRFTRRCLCLTHLWFCHSYMGWFLLHLPVAHIRSTHVYSPYLGHLPFPHVAATALLLHWVIEPSYAFPGLCPGLHTHHTFLPVCILRVLRLLPCLIRHIPKFF